MDSFESKLDHVKQANSEKATKFLTEDEISAHGRDLKFMVDLIEGVCTQHYSQPAGNVQHVVRHYRQHLSEQNHSYCEVGLQDIATRVST